VKTLVVRPVRAGTRLVAECEPGPTGAALRRELVALSVERQLAGALVARRIRDRIDPTDRESIGQATLRRTGHLTLARVPDQGRTAPTDLVHAYSEAKHVR